MYRLIYNEETKEILAVIENCENAVTGTPFSMIDGEPEALARHISANGLVWTADVPETLQAVFTPFAVPPTVSARQIRLWLVGHGVSLATVEAAIDSIPDQTTRDMTRVEWEYAPYVERTHPMLIPLAAALGLTEQQVDQAFREAATI